MSFVLDAKKLIIRYEIIFLLLFILFTLLRSYTPNIEGTEKPLEFVVINSILRGDSFPPQDAWLAGHTINYYYLGQLIFCNLIKLSFVEPAIGFNLITPLIMALIIFGAYGFIRQVTGKNEWGILAAFMVGFMGNIEPVVQIIRNGWDIGQFRWWDAGHVIPNSFPEFPYWSYLLSDVHAHLLVHPFTIAFLVILYIYSKESYFFLTKKDLSNRKKLGLNILYCLILGSFMLINSWNYPSHIALTVAGLYITAQKRFPQALAISNIFRVLPVSLFYILFSYCLYLPFYSHYTSPVEGIGFVTPDSRTTIAQYLILFITFLIPLGVYIVSKSFKAVKKDFLTNISLKISFIIILITFLAAIYLLSKSLPITISLVIACFYGFKLITTKEKTADKIIYSILFLIFSLIICCELIYVNDLFSNDYERQNTVAKFYIQILLLLPLVTPYIMWKIKTEKLLSGIYRDIYVVIISILILASTSFFLIGTYSKNYAFRRLLYQENWHIPTLNGRMYINYKYDGEYNGILWIKNNATTYDVLLEAAGPPYSHYGRVASQTGIPSLLNWESSIGVLRGKFFYNTSAPRVEAINKIYGTVDKTEIKAALSSFGITYIFVGTLERQQYPQEALDAFDHYPQIFEKVFQQGNTVIYKVKHG